MTIVHEAGHAAAGELLYCYNILEPAYAMPIHGEVRHQVANGGIAVKTGVEPENVILAENGSVVDMSDGVVRLVQECPTRVRMPASTDCATRRGAMTRWARQPSRWETQSIGVPIRLDDTWW